MALDRRNKKSFKPSFIPRDNTGSASKGLDFSWSGADRNRTTSFGFGGGGIEGHGFVTTQEVREALDNAFRNQDIASIRALSQHFFRTSGVYARAARYLAYLPTYDYMVVPRVMGMNVPEKTIIRETVNQLVFLDGFKTKEVFGAISLDVIVDGVYFGYLRRKGNKVAIQKLPVKYCRTNSMINGFPTVEFNLDYFETISDNREKIIALNSMPPEIAIEYNKLKSDRVQGRVQKNSSSNKRQPQSGFNGGNWILLDKNSAIAFYFNPSLQPVLANSFFSILDVLELKGIEKKKAENELFNLVVQQFPVNDDGETVFDIVEMKAFHDSAKKIFENSNQTDLLTTFGDIKNIDLNESSRDPLDFSQWKTDIYGELGISPQLFSTQGNMALEKSIAADEAFIFVLVEKYQAWLNLQLEIQFSNRMEEELFTTSFSFLPVTIMNRNEKVQSYKELATFGYSKLLPAIASGQKQLDIISISTYENNIMNIGAIMEPLKSSHTATGDGGGSGGRPPLPDSKKSEKTIANQGG